MDTPTDTLYEVDAKRLCDTLANLEVAVLVERKFATLFEVKNNTLVETLDETLPVTDAEKLGDTVGNVETFAYVGSYSSKGVG